MGKRGWIVTGIIALVGVAGIGALAASGALKLGVSTGEAGAGDTGEVPMQVRFEDAAKGALVRSVSAPGAVEPRTKVQVSAQVLAKILALPFREGETVRKGDVLVRLDGRDLEASLESVQASLRQQEAQLKGAQADEIQARLDLERTRALFPRDATRAQLEGAEAAMLRAESRVLANKQGIEQARAAITRARKDLENTTITSPMDGVIVKLNAEVGETVVVGTLNNASSVIMEVADLSDIVMKARVDEANIAPVRAGQRARVILNAYRDLVLVGTVERVGLKQQVFRDGTAYFEVEIAIDKPKDLTLASGLTANADIEVETFTDVVRVSSQAVVDRRIEDLPKEIADLPLVDKTKTVTRLVYVHKGGKLAARPVKVGASDLTHSVITEGLATGEQVVVGPFRALAELKHEMAVVEQGTKDAQGREVGRKAGEAAPRSFRFGPR